MNNWEPVNTCPIDIQVLLYFAEASAIAQGQQDGDGAWYITRHEDDQKEFALAHIDHSKPTHWQPLLEPPAKGPDRVVKDPFDAAGMSMNLLLLQGKPLDSTKAEKLREAVKNEIPRLSKVLDDEDIAMLGQIASGTAFDSDIRDSLSEKLEMLEGLTITDFHFVKDIKEGMKTAEPKIRQCPAKLFVKSLGVKAGWFIATVTPSAIQVRHSKKMFAFAFSEHEEAVLSHWEYSSYKSIAENLLEYGNAYSDSQFQNFNGAFIYTVEFIRHFVLPNKEAPEG